MPEITKETPVKDIMIGGVILKAPTPFAAGHPLTENEAAALNQTYLENIGNNFRSKVEAVQRRIIAGLGKAEGYEPSDDELKAVTKQQLADFRKQMGELEDGQKLVPVKELQKALAETVKAYEFGVRRTSSVEPVDPVTKEARKLARKLLSDALKEANIKINSVPSDWWDTEIDSVLNIENSDAGLKAQAEAIWDTARKNVQATQSIAKNALKGVNLSGAQAPKE